jgi:hypothetical protein
MRRAWLSGRLVHSSGDRRRMTRGLAMTHPTGYRTRIHVQGELSPAWSVLFADLTVATEPDGTTVISGVLADEAGLHGLLATVRDLGLPVISVEAAATPTQPEHIR